MARVANQAEPRPTGRRAKARLRLGIPGRLVLLDGYSSCLLDDLSQSGACLTIHPPPTAGNQGILQCVQLDVFCTIIWAGGGRCGVRFADQLDVQTLLTMRSFVDNFASHERAEHENRARDWVSGKVRIL